jgi:hypothetical protein
MKWQIKNPPSDIERWSIEGAVSLGGNAGFLLFSDYPARDDSGAFDRAVSNKFSFDKQHYFQVCLVKIVGGEMSGVDYRRVDYCGQSSPFFIVPSAAQ